MSEDKTTNNIIQTHVVQSEEEGVEALIVDRARLQEEVFKYKRKLEEAYARDNSVCEMELKTLQNLLIPVICECINDNPKSFCEVCERDEKIRLSKLVIAIKNYIDAETLRIGLEKDNLIEYKREIMQFGEQIEGYKTHLKDCNNRIIHQRKELDRLNKAVSNQVIKIECIEGVNSNKEVSKEANCAELNDVCKITMLQSYLEKEIGDINVLLEGVEKEFYYFKTAFGVSLEGMHELEQELLPLETKTNRVIKNIIEEYERFTQSRFILTSKKAVLHNILEEIRWIKLKHRSNGQNL